MRLSKDERDTLRALSERIDAHVAERGGNARLVGGRQPGNIVVSYGPGRGEFQTISRTQAEEYVAWLDDGNVGGPWEAGIR